MAPLVVCVFNVKLTNRIDICYESILIKKKIDTLSLISDTTFERKYIIWVVKTAFGTEGIEH